MSIRLRLTLIYSVILALTLIIFSVMLYAGQARATWRDMERRLEDRTENVIRIRQPLPPGGSTRPGNDGRPAPPPENGQVPPPPAPANNPGRPPGDVYLQIRNLEGAVLERDPSLQSQQITLPFDDEAMATVQQGNVVVADVTIEGERFLVRSESVQRQSGTTEIIQVAASLELRNEGLATLRNTLIVGGSVTVIVAFGIGWLIAGLALRPINRITQTARTIGTARDFSCRVIYDGPNDEIGQLTSTLNAMLAELQAAYLQLEQSLEGQRRFIADASHELRTPLTTVRGNLALLQREPPIGPEDRADVLTDMVAETERLMRLVNDLLVLARIDTRRALRSEPVPIRPLIEEVCHQIQSLQPAQTIRCHLNLEASVLGDRDAIKQILLVLLDNAVKHTPPATTINVTAAAEQHRVTISVADDGPGIDRARQRHIFDRFYRGDAARTGSGAGLGLAIARELTEAQQGTISVKSQPGQGCMFRVVLPHTQG